jgi:hypothetical protein
MLIVLIFIGEVINIIMEFIVCFKCMLKKWVGCIIVNAGNCGNLVLGLMGIILLGLVKYGCGEGFLRIIFEIKINYLIFIY